MKIAFRTLLSLTLFLALVASACSPKCDDCSEGGGRKVVYQDSAGTSLFFGPNALYNPDSVIVENGNQRWSPVLDSGEASIYLSFRENTQRIKIFLSNGVVDTLDFDLYEKKSEECCGYYWQASDTKLNGRTIVNTNPTVIVR